MGWLWYTLFGIFLGGMIFNGKMRKAVFHFIGQLWKDEHSSANLMSRRKRGSDIITVRRRDGRETDIDLGDYDEGEE